MYNIKNIYFNAKGRMGRLDFLIYTIPLILYELFLFTVAYFLQTPLVLVFLLLGIWPSLVINVKRLHDLNCSAWTLVAYYIGMFALLAMYYFNQFSVFLYDLIIIYSVVYIYFVYFKKGSTKKNQFGMPVEKSVKVEVVSKKKTAKVQKISNKKVVKKTAKKIIKKKNRRLL